MPPSIEDRLRDTLEAIAEIDDVMKGVSFSQFLPPLRAVMERRIRATGQ